MASTDVITNGRKTGFLHKKGAGGAGWKRRYFVLENSTLRYYKKEEDAKPKGTIDLTAGRGVRTREQCKVEWPSEAQENLCFGVATELRTYYIYATEAQTVEDWMTAIQKVIEKVGKQSDDFETDIEGAQESKLSKAVRGAVEFATKIVKKAASDSGVLSEEQAAAVEAAANTVENQAKADPNTSWKDRAKMGAADGAGVAGHGLNVASEYVPDEYGQAAMTTVGGVLVDQSEADQDMSVTQRLVLAGGSTLEGAADFAGDVQPVADTLTVAGGVVKDQAEADKDMSLKQRVALGVGSAAGGVGELDSLQDNAIAQTVTGLVKAGADAAEEVLNEEEEEEEKEGEEKD